MKFSTYDECSIAFNQAVRAYLQHDYPGYAEDEAFLLCLEAGLTSINTLLDEFILAGERLTTFEWTCEETLKWVEGVALKGKTKEPFVGPRLVFNVVQLTASIPSIEYIGRTASFGGPSPFANPYSHFSGTAARYKVKSRDEAIQGYRRDLFEWVNAAAQPFQTEFMRLVTQARQGKGLFFSCHCKPQSCHGDILGQAIDWASKHCESYKQSFDVNGGEAYAAQASQPGRL